MVKFILRRRGGRRESSSSYGEVTETEFASLTQTTRTQTKHMERLFSDTGLPW